MRYYHSWLPLQTLKSWYEKKYGEFSLEKEEQRKKWHTEVLRRSAAFPAAMGQFMKYSK
jgi:hypothetical protein